MDMVWKFNIDHQIRRLLMRRVLISYKIQNSYVLLSLQVIKNIGIGIPKRRNSNVFDIYM